MGQTLACLFRVELLGRAHGLCASACASAVPRSATGAGARLWPEGVEMPGLGMAATPHGAEIEALGRPGDVGGYPPPVSLRRARSPRTDNRQRYAPRKEISEKTGGACSLSQKHTDIFTDSFVFFRVLCALYRAKTESEQNAEKMMKRLKP